MIFRRLFGGKKDEGGGAEVGGTKELLTLTRRLPVSADRAFSVFVDEIGRWWPRERSWAKDNLDTVLIEPRYGGRALERSKDGSTAVFGTVLAFDRPAHIVLAWQIAPSGGPEESEGSSSRVDVRFAADGPEATNLLLVHRDFFRHGEGWEKYREQMAAKTGWPALIEAYVKAVAG